MIINIEKDAAKIIITTMLVLTIIGIAIGAGIPYTASNYDPGHDILDVGNPNYYFAEDTYPDGSGRKFLTLELKDDAQHQSRFEIRPGVNAGFIIRQGAASGSGNNAPALQMNVATDRARINFIPANQVDTGIAYNQLELFMDYVQVLTGLNVTGNLVVAGTMDVFGRLYTKPDGNGFFWIMTPETTPTHAIGINGTSVQIGSTNPREPLNLYYTGNLARISDISLKENILPLNNSLGKILALKGVEYNFKGDDEKELGFVAQQVEQVLPEAVSTGEDGLKYVDYQTIIPVLVEAMKEQQKQIDELEKRVEELEKNQ